jgi:hypothetical protein
LRSIQPVGVGAYVVGLLAHACLAVDAPVTCATCHQEQAGELAQSVHTALDCQICHGGESSYTLSAEEAKKYASSGPTGDSPLAFDHGALFMGKASRREVPERCGGCHAEVERMNPYGLRTDQLTRYRASGHGKTLAAKVDDRVAVCIDCHGVHDVLPGREPASKTYPLNVPATCAVCHADAELMAEFDLAVEVVDEYRRSVHGRLMFEQQDTGAPTCATCHGNHSAVPPGFATIGAVCGRCHEHAALNFATSIHAGQEEHKGCVQCHGGGEGRHFHLIERITKPTGLLIHRYTHLLESEPTPTPQQIAKAIHPDPKQIITRALPTCMECHEDIEDDESLPKLFELLDAIAAAERLYVETGRRLSDVGEGVLLVDRQRFLFEDAKTHLIELAPLQHTLDNEKVAAKVAELNAACNRVNTELDELEAGLALRHRMLIPIWAFSALFAALLYAKYKQLKAKYVKPLPPGSRDVERDGT